MIIGVITLCIVVPGCIFAITMFSGGGPTPTAPKGWVGGVESTRTPSGYTAVVDNSNVVIAVGEITHYDSDNTIMVDLYVDNYSSNALYLVFIDNYFDGKKADYSDVYSGIIRTEPYGRDESVIYIDCIHNTHDLHHWRGTILVIDDDTYEDDDPVVLGEYDFDITFNW